MSNPIIKDATDRMEKSFNLLKEQYKGLRSTQGGGWVDSIKVEYYGSQTPLQQLASVTTPFPGKFVIKPYDPSCVKDIEKAIVKANMGVGVTSEKTSVVISIPRMTTEQRDKLADHAIEMANETKVAIRQIRQDARKHLQKAKLPEDDEKRADKELQSLTDDYCEKADALGKQKSAAILED